MKNTNVETVVVFNMGEEGVSFFLADEDLTRFDGVVVNHTETGYENELADMDFGDKITTSQARSHIRNGAYLVNCGF